MTAGPTLNSETEELELSQETLLWHKHCEYECFSLGFCTCSVTHYRSCSIPEFSFLWRFHMAVHMQRTGPESWSHISVVLTANPKKTMLWSESEMKLEKWIFFYFVECSVPIEEKLSSSNNKHNAGFQLWCHPLAGGIPLLWKRQGCRSLMQNTRTRIGKLKYFYIWWPITSSCCDQFVTD